MRGRKWSPAEREQYRQRAKALNLGRFLKSGYHGPLWTPEQVALLGTMLDEEVAVRIGRSVTGVRLKRSECGIPTFHDRSCKDPR